MIIDTLRNMRPANGRTKMLARAFALAMLLLVALALQSGSPVEAQTSGTLVSNKGQTGTTDGSVALDHAQAFTTGPSSTGYKLIRVEVDFSVDTGTQVGYAMEIWSDSSGSPGSLLHTLNKPGTLSVGTNNFAASGGIDLDANATYHVVYNVDDTGGAAKIRYTTSDDEDSGTAVGWSIANGGRYRTYSSSG